MAKIADRAGAAATPRVRLAASVAENVINDVNAAADRTVTAAQQQQLVPALAELGRAEASSVAGDGIDEALKPHMAMIAETLTKLEGDTIFLPGPPGTSPLKVTLGKVLGKGAFGWVFPILDNGQPSDKVIKILGNNISYLRAGYTDLPATTPALLDNIGGDSLLSQAKGAVVLRRLGIATPRIGYMHPAQKAGEFSFAIMDRIDINTANIDVWTGNKFSLVAKRAAIADLHQRLARGGYIAADLAPRNVYFTLQGDVVRAGVWDADLIVGAPSLENAAVNARFRGVLGGAAKKRNLTKTDYTDLFYEIDYRDARQAMDIIQTIQWGKLQ